MSADADPQSSPAAVVLAALAAASAGDWRRFAGLADAAAAREWRDGYLARFARVPTVEEFAAGIEGIPPEDFASHVERHRDALAAIIEREYVAPRREFEANIARDGWHGLAAVRTLAALAALPPADFVAAYLASEDRIEQHRRLAAEAYAAAGRPLPAAYTGPRRPRRFVVLREAPAEAPAEALSEPLAGAGEVDVDFQEVDAGGDAVSPELTWRARADAAGRWGVVLTVDLIWGELRNDLRGREVAWLMDDPVVSQYALRREYHARFFPRRAG